MVVVSPPTVKLPVTEASPETFRVSKVPRVEKRLVVVALVPVAERKVRVVRPAVLSRMRPENVESVIEAEDMELFLRVPPFARSFMAFERVETSESDWYVTVLYMMGLTCSMEGEVYTTTGDLAVRTSMKSKSSSLRAETSKVGSVEATCGESVWSEVEGVDVAVGTGVGSADVGISGPVVRKERKGILMPCILSMARTALSLSPRARDGEKYPRVVRPPESTRTRAIAVRVLREKYGDLSEGADGESTAFSAFPSLAFF